MPSSAAVGRRSTGRAAWKFEDARARFRELVRRARADGPQVVTVRGRPVVVVVDAEEYARLTARRPKEPRAPFLEALLLHGLDLTRDRDNG